MASAKRLALIPLLLVLACHEPDVPTAPTDLRMQSAATGVVGVQQSSEAETILYGSSPYWTANPASLFRIDHVDATATLIGASGVTVGSERISAIDFDPFSGRLYGIKGGGCYGAILITIDPATGAGSVVGTVQGSGLDFTPGPNCPGGAAALAFASDGTMYVGAWYGGVPQGKIMTVDRKTATVFEYHSTPYGFGDWQGRRAHIAGMAVDANGTVWISRGGSLVTGQINTIDPTTGDITRTVYLTDAAREPEVEVTISDLAFAPDGTLYASTGWESELAIIDTVTGELTRIGTYDTSVVEQIAGLTAVPAILQHLLGRYWFREAAAGRGPAAVLDDMPAPVDLSIDYDASIEWTEVDGHRGLRVGRPVRFRRMGGVAADATGSKYQEALVGATQATFVTVASRVDPPWAMSIAGFRGRRECRSRRSRDHCGLPFPVAMFGTLWNGRPSVTLRTSSQPLVLVTWDAISRHHRRHGSHGRDPASGYDEHRVFHVVYDADDPVPERRVRLYVDGVDQGPGRLLLGRPPVPGEGLDFDVENLELQIMPRLPVWWERDTRTVVFYHAVYKAALTPAEIAGNALALLRDDDDL
jgi:sugar lactone lactonase YvrE